MELANAPNHRNCISSPPTFTVSVDGKFHGFPWLVDYYLIFENICAWHIPLIYHIWKKMDIRKVKVDHLTLLACLPLSLGLVCSLVEEATRIYAGLFGNIFIQIKWTKHLKPAGNCYSLGTGKQFYILLRLGYYPLLSLAVLAFKFIHCLLLSIVIYYIVYWVHQCSIIWPSGP